MKIFKIFKELIESKQLQDKDTPHKIIVYHGTNNKHVKSIKQNGLKSSISSANWFMVSTDFESALYHATPLDKNTVPVIEFKVPITNDKWFGYPYFWPPNKRNEDSIWFGLKETIPPEYINKIYQVPYNEWIKQKNNRY